MAAWKCIACASGTFEVAFNHCDSRESNILSAASFRFYICAPAETLYEAHMRQFACECAQRPMHRPDHPRAARQDTRNLLGTLTRLVDSDAATHAERRGLRLLRTPP